MSEESKKAIIPTITNTGSTGTQVEGMEETRVADTIRPFTGITFPEVFHGLASTKSRGMGGEIVANMTSAMVSHLDRECNTTKEELQAALRDKDRLREELFIAEKKAAVLDERLKSSKRESHLKNVILPLGTVFVGIGIKINQDNNSLGLVVSGLGVLLLLFGWFFTGKVTEK